VSEFRNINVILHMRTSCSKYLYMSVQEACNVIKYIHINRLFICLIQQIVQNPNWIGKSEESKFPKEHVFSDRQYVQPAIGRSKELR